MLNITSNDVWRIVQTRDGTIGVITGIHNGVVLVHSADHYLNGEWFTPQGELHTEAGGGLDLVAFLEYADVPEHKILAVLEIPQVLSTLRTPPPVRVGNTHDLCSTYEELNLSNDTDVDVRRLNDWAAQAYDVLRGTKGVQDDTTT